MLGLVAVGQIAVPRALVAEEQSAAVSGYTGSNVRGYTGSNVRGYTGSNVRGYTGSNVRGYTGSNVRGYTGSNVRGYTGSNVRGYTGSNVRGYTGSNVRGYTGSNVRGYTGSNVRGYTGSNVRGYTGSNVRGYTGSNVRGYTGSNVRSVSVEGSAAALGAFDSAAIGPVTSVVADGPMVTLVIAGQSFSVEADQIQGLVAGDYVAAGARDSGEIVVYALGVPYVPGVSPVSARGVVQVVDRQLGRVSLGGMQIDYTPQLPANPDLVINVGDQIAVSGILAAVDAYLLVGSDSASLVRGNE